MNILFCAISTSSNNRDKFTYTFIEKEMTFLSNKGHNVFFISEVLEEDLQYNGVKYISYKKNRNKSILKWRIKTLLFLLRNIRYFGSMLFTSPRRLISVCSYENLVVEVCKKNKISVIHTHFCYPYGNNCVLAAGILKIPVISTFRGAEVYNRQDLNYGALLDQDYERLLIKSQKYVNYFTSPNEEILSIFKNKYLDDTSKIEVVHNGVEDINMNKNSKKLSLPIRLISIGGLIERKNLEMLVEVASAYDQDIELNIVGKGPLEGKLNELIESRDCRNVKIHHELSKINLYNFMLQHHFLIHPSFIEGMPNVVMESLFLGIPCIVSDIMPHRGLVLEGVNGYLFDPMSSKDLEKKIDFIISKSINYEKLVDNCNKYFSHEFTLDYKINQYERIYRANT